MLHILPGQKPRSSGLRPSPPPSPPISSKLRFCPIFQLSPNHPGTALEEENPESQRNFVGNGDNWRLFVELVQAVWTHGIIPRQMLWSIVVLIPKGGGDYRGIGLLEPIWKVLKRIMDRRLDAIELHDCLHGCRAHRGTGTGVIEAKLAQQLI